VKLAPEEQRSLQLTTSVTTPGKPALYDLNLRLLRADGSVEAETKAKMDYLGPRRRFVIKAVADALVIAGTPEANKGREITLGVDGGNQQMGDMHHAFTYLRFPLALVGKPVSVKLRLRVTDTGESIDSGNIHLVDAPWAEEKITYKNRPPSAKQVGKMGRIANAAWEERVLDMDLTGRTEICFVIEPTNLDGAGYFSREGGQAPELVVECEPGQ
jgi:hypothetical protein